MQKNNTLLYVLAVIMACWFAVIGAFWAYWIALFLAYPFGIISLLIWLTIKKDDKKRNVAIPAILGAGLFLSLATLLYLVLFR